MHEQMTADVYHAQIQSFLEGNAQNGIGVSDDLVEAAGEEFKAAIRRQFQVRDPAFRVRMSNIGRPLCQLQMDKAGADQTSKPAKFLIQMLLGDSMECIMRMIIKASGINVTSDGDKVELDVEGETIKGESDIDLDGAVWDIKSVSPYGFTKWVKGYSALAQDDPFGYIGQLVGYADGQNKPLGGWVVGNKSDGDFVVVPATPSVEEIDEIRKARAETVNILKSDAEFERCFEAEEETYYKKPTGEKILPFTCEWCDFKRACWPNAEYRPKTTYKGRGSPPMKWYAE